MQEKKFSFEQKNAKLNEQLRLIEISSLRGSLTLININYISINYILYEYLSGWPETTKEKITRSCLCQRKKNCLNSCFLKFFLRGLFLLLIQ